jgi:hypothetical protein
MRQEPKGNELVLFDSRGVWTAWTKLRFFGLPIGARMTVIRFPTNELFVYSPLGLNDKIKRQLSELGQVQYVVSPNHLHHLFLTDYQEACPNAKIYASPGLEEKRTDIRFHKQLTDAPEPEWIPYLDQMLFAGVPSMREVIFYHKASRTLLVADLIMNYRDTASLTMKFLLKMFHVYGHPFSSIDIHKLEESSKDLVKFSIQQILDWDFDRIILSHGEMIDANGKDVIREVFSGVLDA